LNPGTIGGVGDGSEHEHEHEHEHEEERLACGRRTGEAPAPGSVATPFKDPDWLAEERALVARARAGDRAAVGRLYDTFAGPLYARVLLPRLGEPEAARDALAETFRVALERLAEWRDEGVSLWFWLTRVAANKAMDLHRERARAGRALHSLARLLAPLATAGQPAPDDLDAAELARLRARVQEVLARLAPRYRTALALRFLEERSRAECAAALMVKLPTFDVVLLRALRAFRREWDAPEEETT
jgi:RNA polymerase sigma-70 factor (ECF subfamily)